MNESQPQTIRPVQYAPPAGRNPKPRRGPSARVLVLALAALIAVLAAAFFAFSRSVRIEIEPNPESLSVSGGLGIAVGDGHLLLPGNYRFAARAEGYVPLEGSFTVGPEREQSFSYKMQRLPGLLSIVSDPPGAEVFVDDTRRGQTPLDKLELSTGPHQVLVRAPRYQAFATTFDIEGGGVAQGLNVTLEPGWAPVRIQSRPSGAEILSNGETVGTTPATIELGGGRHSLSLQLAGYQTWRDQVTVLPNQAIDLGVIELSAAKGNVQISSTPAGASVNVDGQYRGRTPLGLDLAPERLHALRLSAEGHRAATRELTLASGASQDLHVKLEPILGSVRLEIEPADARVRVDGRTLEAGRRQLNLTTVTHRVEVSKPGYATQTVEVRPRESIEQTVAVSLQSNAKAVSAGLASRIESKAGPSLVLVKPGGFTMGSRRGTQGRQSNEPERRIRLTQPFYLSRTEVTNAEFRRFRPSHSSGIFKRHSLDNERQPVVRVSWDDAVAYCNWLSKQDGLEPAYVQGPKGMQLSSPPTTGYRLPTEAEWEWAARFAGGRSLRYPWGDAMPPTAGSGNYAGAETDGLVATSLAEYRDEAVTTHTVGQFPASAIGLFDMGGNVAEWTHDRYTPLPSLGGQEETDPMGPEEGNGHVVRGSSWMHGSLVPLRLAYRDLHSGKRPDLGFRVARYAR